MNPGLKRLLTGALLLAAMLLRIAMPGLHTHSESCNHTAHPVAVTCSCGHHHAAPEPRRGGRDDADGPEAAADAHRVGHHHCLACDIELGSPCGCPAPAKRASPTRSIRAEAKLYATPVHTMDRSGLPQPRAPPRLVLAHSA